MKRTWWAAAVCWVAIAAAVCDGAEEQWLQYKVAENLYQTPTDANRVLLPLDVTAPEGVAMPKFEGGKQYFAKWLTPMAKDGFRWIALDIPSEDEILCTVYIDADGDGSLADDAPLKQTPESCGCIGPVKFAFETPEGAVTYHLLLMHDVREQTAGAEITSIAALKKLPKTHYLLAASACYSEGDVAVDGRKYRCGLYDFDANGTFDDASANPMQADRIKITTDAGVRLHAPGKYIQLGGKLYRPEASKDGAFVSFTPVENVATGTVRVPSSVFEVGLAGEPGIIYLNTRGGAAEAPVGKYVLFRWQTDRKDKSGVEWKMSGTDCPPTAFVDVVEGKEAYIDCGEPAIAWLGSMKTGDKWQLSAGLRGRLGETVKIAMGNGTPPPTPDMRIANADGAYNRAYRLEYG